MRTIMVMDGEWGDSLGASLKCNKHIGNFSNNLLRIRFLHGIALATVMAVGGCTNTMNSDVVYDQERSVSIGRANFETCVTAAVGDVRSAALNRQFTYPWDIVLDVNIGGDSRLEPVEIQSRSGGEVRVIWDEGRRKRSTDETRRMDPILDQLADAIRHKCSSGKGDGGS